MTFAFQKDTLLLATEHGYGGLVLGLIPLLILSLDALNMTLTSKVVKIDSKIFVTLCYSKSVAIPSPM